MPKGQPQRMALPKSSSSLHALVASNKAMLISFENPPHSKCLRYPTPTYLESTLAELIGLNVAWLSEKMRRF